MKIFLIGLMGSGKSFWAKKLSTILNIPAFDLDTEIEKIESKTVTAIFTEQGEDYFRLAENIVLKSFAHKNNFVLATGGGAACFHDNIDWMNKNGITIWIDDSTEIIADRLRKEKAHRPLIASVKDENLKDFLTEMREKRKAFYSQAAYCLTGNFTETDFLKIIASYE
ncbi:MAG: shikimate kinase [Parafilimonas sp.]